MLIEIEQSWTNEQMIVQLLKQLANANSQKDFWYSKCQVLEKELKEATKTAKTNN